MKKLGTVGVFSFILGICIADSKSLIPTLVLFGISFVLITGNVLCAGHC